MRLLRMILRLSIHPMVWAWWGGFVLGQILGEASAPSTDPLWWTALVAFCGLWMTCAAYVMRPRPSAAGEEHGR